MKKFTKKDFFRVSGSSNQIKGNLLGKSRKASSKAKEVDPNELWSLLQGTWVGNTGFNLVAVPSRGSSPDETGDFRLITNDYTEILTFTNPGAPAPNKGGNMDQFVAALEYNQRVSDKKNNELLHVENGMFLNLNDIVDNNGKFHRPTFPIARSGTIPHGNSIMLLGAMPVSTSGAPSIPKVDPRPDDIGKFEGGFNDYKGSTYAPYPDGNEALKRVLAQQKKDKLNIIETITFGFNSKNEGGITNVPFGVDRAETISMDATFWLERVENDKGNFFYQLQYSQNIIILFHRKFGKDNKPKPGENRRDHLIAWPHITVNTLVKQ